ncbi:MAG: 1-(5-phosphoribosyl)-5-[(5-phosphoribosylamino)methylideneamino]imidazole-4-carboxamide isomerase [Bacteroidales bacterium]|nr:1-(5-phosphoribosyl)-5-[(5-phosphoribosylamino)methylideneamino]imidazole-4-carboxamide isomerase [Bacteroidales bacterium]
MMEIVPAIDMIEGRCVRLSQGDFNKSKEYDASPLEMAKRYEDVGVRRLHLVDLDGARAGIPQNLRNLEQIASATSLEVEWGGGVRSRESIASVLNAGAAGVICGSLALQEPRLFSAFLKEYGEERIILGADISGGKIATKGWLEISSSTIEEVIELFLKDGLKRVICTDISKDGMLQGPAVELYSALMERFPTMHLTASGGVGAMADLENLEAAGVPAAIVGKAIFEERITLKEIERWQLRG